MLKIITLKSRPNPPFPPTGGYSYPNGKRCNNSINICNASTITQLRPNGVRQPGAEANIIGKIRAITGGWASIEGDIIGR